MTKPVKFYSAAILIKRSFFVGLAVFFASSCEETNKESTNQGKNPTSLTQSAVENSQPKQVADFWPKLDIAVKPDTKIENKVKHLLSQMTLEQKVAQMIQPEIGDFTVEDMRRYGFGSYLNGGGSFPNKNKHATPADWINLAEAMYQASIDDSLDGSSIPTMWGTDAVHGHNNVIGATLFPHNIGLGAADNPALIEKIAAATAKEVMVTGIDWVFAPTVAVVRDDRWGRTYEGYSEDPDIVKSYAAAIVKGLQGKVDADFLGEQRVIATVKHFVGDGGTEKGDDQGNNIADEKQLFEIHSQGYVGGLTAGAQTVMASFNSWHGKKNHGNKYLLTDVLKQRMGFDGFVVGDWNGHGQVKGCSNQSCPQSINAGLDVFMVPTDAWKPLLENTIAQIKQGEIPMSRVDDAVSRILRVKLRAGLFEKPSPAKRPLSGKTELIGAKEHRVIARQAVRESLVLVKNKNQLLPLSPKQKFLIAGDAANNIGKQSGGWTITWQGTGNNNQDFPGGSSIYDGLKKNIEAAGGSVELNEAGNYQSKPDVAIMVFGEEPYAEGNGDLDNLEYQRGNKKDLAILQKLRAQNIPVVSIFISGRPLWINAELNASDAFVVAWLPGSEGEGVADVVLKKSNGDINFDFKGKLSFSWPDSPLQLSNRHDKNYQPLLPYGYGLNYSSSLASHLITGDDLTEEFVAGSQQLTTINLFNAPWRPAVSSGGKMKLINSSQFQHQQLNYQTYDKDVQEDARLVQFNGKDMAAVEINDNFPFDLRGYYEANAALAFTVQVDSPATEPVYLSMRCEPECQADIDISSYLSKAEPDQWQSFSIDLACFANQGATMDKIVAPFSLKTRGKLTLKYTDVKIIPNHTKQSSVVCAKQS